MLWYDYIISVLFTKVYPLFINHFLYSCSKNPPSSSPSFSKMHLAPCRWIASLSRVNLLSSSSPAKLRGWTTKGLQGSCGLDTVGSWRNKSLENMAENRPLGPKRKLERIPTMYIAFRCKNVSFRSGYLHVILLEFGCHRGVVVFWLWVDGWEIGLCCSWWW